MSWQPDSNYRHVYHKGLSGWDVWVVQVAINSHGYPLVLDGAFGPATDAAVRKLQSELKIKVDGVFGPTTSEKLCAKECASAEQHVVPTGLLHGLVDGESGGEVACVSTAYADGSRDYFAFQKHALHPGDAQLAVMANVKGEAKRVANETRITYARLKKLNPSLDERRAWELAILDHNWPYAAEQIAKGNTKFLEAKAAWVEKIGAHENGRLISTGWEWVNFYIKTKSIYVTSWHVA